MALVMSKDVVSLVNNKIRAMHRSTRSNSCFRLGKAVLVPRRVRNKSRPTSDMGKARSQGFGVLLLVDRLKKAEE
jgi:hypothetical protein